MIYISLARTDVVMSRVLVARAGVNNFILLASEQITPSNQEQKNLQKGRED